MTDDPLLVLLVLAVIIGLFLIGTHVWLDIELERARKSGNALKKLTGESND